MNARDWATAYALAFGEEQLRTYTSMPGERDMIDAIRTALGDQWAAQLESEFIAMREETNGQRNTSQLPAPNGCDGVNTGAGRGDRDRVSRGTKASGRKV